MTRNYYSSGQHNVICDVCGKKVKIGDCRERWDGFLVHHGCYEIRHPQDFVRARQDKISVPITRPIQPIVFVPVDYNDYWDFGYTMDGYIDGDNV